VKIHITSIRSLKDADLVADGFFRPICKRRAKVLRRRGEHVRWSGELDCYIWERNHPCKASVRAARLAYRLSMAVGQAYAEVRL
jgi:hypothetical protein